jgi:hypothetical protein
VNDAGYIGLDVHQATISAAVRFCAEFEAVNAIKDRELGSIAFHKPTSRYQSVQLA